MSCICSIVDNAVASEAKDRRFESYQVHIVKNEKSPVNGALFLRLLYQCQGHLQLFRTLMEVVGMV